MVANPEDLTMLNADPADAPETVRKLSELTAIVGHDLRNPLGSLMLAMDGMAEAMLPQLEGKQADDARFFFDMARRSARRLMRLTDDLVDNHRVLAGGLRVARKPCLVAELLEEVVAEQQGLADHAGVTLVVEGGHQLVWGDYDRLIQALSNLLGNAIKFSPRGGRVVLATQEHLGEVRLTVTDQGRGIPADRLGSIFQPFEQVEATDASQLGGAGLGLAIVRAIAAAHGGRVWAESEPGCGACFVLALPVRTRQRA